MERYRFNKININVVNLFVFLFCDKLIHSFKIKTEILLVLLIEIFSVVIVISIIKKNIKNYLFLFFKYSTKCYCFYITFAV